MTDAALTVLVVGALPEGDAAVLQSAGWSVQHAADLEDAAAHDAVLLCLAGAPELTGLPQRPGLAAAAFESALVIACAALDESAEAALLNLGAEAFVHPGQGGELPRALRHAVQRKRLERAARTAYATDLATGLPHQTQLIEHMTQLLALREREPAPMVLLVLRIEGYAQAAARLGAEAGNVLRRKVAVRLRAQLRASDVVAAISPEAFGVLLGRLESAADGERVAAKLVRSLHQPIQVAGQACSVGAAVGMALYPEHGKDADTLLKRASAQAGSVATVGKAGYAATVHRIGSAAANDDLT